MVILSKPAHDHILTTTFVSLNNVMLSYSTLRVILHKGQRGKYRATTVSTDFYPILCTSIDISSLIRNLIEARLHGSIMSVFSELGIEQIASVCNCLQTRKQNEEKKHGAWSCRRLLFSWFS